MRAAIVLLAGASLAIAVSPPAQAAETQESPSPVNAWSDAKAPEPSRVIVRWAGDASRADRVQARAAVDTQDFTGLGKRFQVLALPEGEDASEAVARLEKDPAVADAGLDGYSELHAISPDPLFDQLWGLDNQGIPVGGAITSTAGADIDAIKAWTKTTGSKSVIVADLDDGIRPQHPDLKNRIWNNADELPADGIDNDGNGYVDDTFGMDFAGPDIEVDPLVFDNDPTDDIPQGGHGTHTAGTIAAQGNNGEGITGVAQEATIMPLRVCGLAPSASRVFCPYSAQIAAINYAGANGAKIANMSLGGTFEEPLVRDAFAANPQVLFVISAGNDGRDTQLSGQTTFPCSYDPTTSSVQGAVDNVVCVAASDQDDARANFSNWGKTNVDIAAPGTETLSTYTTAPAFTETFEGSFGFTGWTNGGWKHVSGDRLTSFGITNDTATQTGGTTRTLQTPTVTVSGPGLCTLSFFRTLTSTGNDSQSINDEFLYRGVVNGTPQSAIRGVNQAPGVYATNFPVPAGSSQVAVSFSFRKGTNTAASNGVWLDDVKLTCWVPPGQESSESYGFLQGTSMAAPHVTGTAALLASYEPQASTMQLKQALLSTVDAVAQFNPDTGFFPISTGGRLNADKALDKIDALVAPETRIDSGPSGTTTDTNATVTFSSPAKNPVSFECRIDGAAFSACTSPVSLNGLAVGTHTFEVRAKDTPGNADPTPATASWTVAAPPPPQVKPALAAPTKVTGVKVKRKKTKATITWSAVSGATSYRVTVGKTTKTTTKPSFTVKKLKPKSKATVRIAAVNSAGSSPVVTVKVKRAK
ncbi:MAG: hypothetical protein E6Q90_12825 [Actinobacteria bacterium]|nr:MAG: hypothetical protein E6Q90_12825 [Actinomycetota bacterium]